MKKTKLWAVVISISIIFCHTVKLDVCAEEYVYDELNRLIKVVYDDGGSVEYVYDRNGNILRTIVSVADDTEAEVSPQEGSQAENTSEDDTSADNTSENNSSKNDSSEDAALSNSQTNQEADKSKPSTSRDDSLFIKGQGDEGTKEPLYKAEANTVSEDLELYVQNIVTRITECARNMFCENA